MVTALESAGADLIGTNCGNGMENMIDIVKEIRQTELNIPVVVHANAGMPQYEEGETVFPETPGETASHVQGLVDAGANIIGGCCGTTPEHLAKIKEILNRVKKY